MKKVNLIGGSGFIGTRLARRLVQNSVDFNIIDKKNSHSFPELTKIADVREISELKSVINGNAIINLAAEHRDDVTPKSLYDEVNVNGVRNICEVAEEKGIQKIIFTSSVAVYGFAPINTGENGKINFFNDYGRTKYEAEQILKTWQEKDSLNRSLVIIRPTVVFGEQNRGNVYNLLKQISSGKFVMIGKGENRKSLAYVENVAAFLEFALNFNPGIHIYNYVDKPDLDMNSLVRTVYKIIGKKDNIGFRLPYNLGLFIGGVFDVISTLSRKKFPISKIRVEKFCKNTSFSSKVEESGFNSPVDLLTALNKTVTYEFIEKNHDEVFVSE